MRRWLTLFSLILAGEAIFGLPFHITRFFRPTFVEVFGVSQTQLGVLGAIYGVVAMLSYLAGGVVADRYSVRGLLAFSLLITGASGLYLSTIPSLTQMGWLYAFWGASTILPFWAALIKATRSWGGDQQQGAAFGVLDGGRGLFAAVLAMLALGVFALDMPSAGEAATREQQTLALQAVILAYTSACVVAAAFVWLFIPPSRPCEELPDNPGVALGKVLAVCKMPAVWLQAFLIMAAYSMYKGTDFYSQFARDVWGWSELNAAGLSAMSTWARPVAAIGAGLLADRFCSSRVLIGCFVLAGVAYVAMVLTPPGYHPRWLPPAWLLWMSVLPASLGVFAMRGVYFALLEESHIPIEVTGTAVGVVSFIGFTPEIIMPLLGGWLIDHWSGGPTGYLTLYGFLAVVAMLGVLAAVALRRLNSH